MVQQVLLESNSFSRLDLGCSRFDPRWGEKIDSTKLLFDSVDTEYEGFGVCTWSSSPQTQAAPSGASARFGTSFRLGNLVQLGSKGTVVAVLFMVRMSLI